MLIAPRVVADHILIADRFRVHPGGPHRLEKLKRASNPYSPDGFDVGTTTGPSRNFVEMTIAQLVIALGLPAPRLSATLFNQIETLLAAVARELAPPPRLGTLPLLALSCHPLPPSSPRPA